MENKENIGLLCIECRIRSAWLVRNAEQTLGDPRGQPKCRMENRE